MSLPLSPRRCYRAAQDSPNAWPCTWGRVITLVPLPAYSPELNPVERVWLYLRERFLSLRVFRDYRAIVDACCAAWNRLVAEPGRLRSLCDQPWIRKVTL